MDELNLTKWAKKIRYAALHMIHCSTGGHPGGALSIAELIAVLYFSTMRIDPSRPDWSKRDRLVLSKGHGCAALYAALGLKGYFDPAEFDAFRQVSGLLQGHPSIHIPGIDAPSGSLGMGLSQGLGMALGGKYQGTHFRTYVILGDGDMQEGNTWEAFMAASQHKVSSLCAILDMNGLQAEGKVEDIMNYQPVVQKAEAFGWHVINVDGHDCNALCSAFAQAASRKDKPTLLIAETIKGKGVSFMEKQPQWHGTVTITERDWKQAIAEIGCIE